MSKTKFDYVYLTCFKTTVLYFRCQQTGLFEKHKVPQDNTSLTGEYSTSNTALSASEVHYTRLEFIHDKSWPASLCQNDARFKD